MLTRSERKKRRQDRKALIQARRMARRKARSVQKNDQRAKLKVLKDEVAKTPSMNDLETTIYEEQFSKVWPAVRAALEFSISLRISRERLDKTLSRIVLIGDKMATGNDLTDEESLEFLEKLERVWDWVRGILTVVIALSPDGKVDQVIDKIIEIGDWILGDDDDQVDG